MIIYTPFYNANGARYAYELHDKPGVGWTATFDRGILHDDDAVALNVAIEAMLKCTADMAAQTAFDICLDAVKGAKSLEGAVDALERLMPPEQKGPDPDEQ